MNQKSIVIIGPTASGKSDIAIALAQHYDGEIISADSRQIYRHLDIGTGKEPGKITIHAQGGPSTQKTYLCENIPHYMIDIIEPKTEYNVAKFTKRAKKIHQDIHARYKLPIICGGTMFWAQALIEESLFPPVLPHVKLRKKLTKKSNQELVHILTTLDPAFVKKVDIHNPVRLIRAIEIATKLGYVPEITKKPIDHNRYLILAVMPPKELLHEKIEKRMDGWFDRGLCDEIYNAHFFYNMPWTKLENFGLEYKWCTRYVRGHITYDVMRENTIRDLKKYAKRQITWIRRWEKQKAPIHRIATQQEAHTLTKNFLM